MRHARQLLDFIEKRSTIASKQNVLVNNFNVVKTGCLLIEILDELSYLFDQLKVRCTNIRNRIEEIVSKYMMAVKGEQEMRYLLLEKDFEDRDSLDLITSHSIFSFLESQFAENVVKEIWRSPYATNDSIFTASTNYYFLFQYYDCITDNEYKRRFWAGKDIKHIENHPM